MSATIEKQNQIIISLLARTTLGEEYIGKLVRTGKKKVNADAYVLAYNALDGTKSASLIAKMLGVSQQSVSQMFQAWEDKGIVYRLNEKSPYYGLLKLPAKTRRSVKAAKKKSSGGTRGSPKAAEKEGSGASAPENPQQS